MHVSAGTEVGTGEGRIRLVFRNCPGTQKRRIVRPASRQRPRWRAAKYHDDGGEALLHLFRVSSASADLPRRQVRSGILDAEVPRGTEMDARNLLQRQTAGRGEDKCSDFGGEYNSDTTLCTGSLKSRPGQVHRC